jgi:hypothetical protein
MAEKAAKPAPAGRRWRFPWKGGVGVGCAVVAVLSVVLTGLMTAMMVRHKDRFNLPLTAIDYGPPPAWIDPAEFLTEVRYLGDLPEKFQSYDPAETDRVKAAFAKHPWVEAVSGGYTTVALKYSLVVVFREPMLVVSTPAGPRTVDAKGVLLPAGPMIAGVAELVGERAEPKAAAGQVWDDPTVKRAAELAKQFNAKAVEKTAAGWRVTERTGRALVVGW